MANTVWHGSRYGYSVEYPGSEASVAARSADGMMLQSQPQDGSTGIILIQAVRSSQLSPWQALKAQVSSLQGVSQVAVTNSPAA